MSGLGSLGGMDRSDIAPLDTKGTVEGVASRADSNDIEPEIEAHDHAEAREVQHRKLASFSFGGLALEGKLREYQPEVRGAAAASDFAQERRTRKGFPRVFRSQGGRRGPGSDRPKDRDLGTWADGVERWLKQFDGPKMDRALLEEAKELNAFLKQKLTPAQYKKVVLQLPQRYADALYGSTPLTTRRLGSLDDPAPLLDTTLQRLQARKGELLRTAFKDAKKGTPLHEVSRILKARELAKTSKFKDDVDPAKLKALDARLNELLKDDSLQKKLAEIQKQATREVFADVDPALATMTPKQAVAALAKKQEAYLKGPAFRAHVADLKKHRGAKAADEYVAKELQKLVGLDPQRGAAAAREIAAREIVDKADDILKATSASELEKPLAAILTERLGDAKKATGIAKTLSQIISKVGEDRDAAIKALESMGDDGAEALKLLSTTPTEFFSHVAKATSLALVAAKGKPSSAGEWLTIAKESLSIAKSIVTAGALSPSSLKTILSEGDELLKLSKSINLAGRLLGAAAGAIGSAMSLYQAGKDFADGDMVGGALKLVGGLAAMGGTIMAVAGMSGPAAPIVLVIGLAATVLDGLFGESDDETLMRQMGLLKSTGSEGETAQAQ